MAKTLISIRLDSDLLDWFKTVDAPGGYQTRINEVLNQYRLDRRMREQRILGQASLLFQQYHARCFWHLKKDLEITSKLIPIVQNGLRKYGGLEGLRLASQIDPLPEKGP